MTDDRGARTTSARRSLDERRRKRLATVLVLVAAVAVLCFVVGRWVAPSRAAFPVTFP